MNVELDRRLTRPWQTTSARLDFHLRASRQTRRDRADHLLASTTALGKGWAVKVLSTLCILAAGLTLGCASAEPPGASSGKIETFRLAGAQPSADCAIRIDGVVKACRRSERPEQGEMLASYGRFGWPRGWFDGLSCSDALCLAADDHRIDLYSAKSFPPVRFRRIVVVRREEGIVAIAMSAKDGRDHAWRGMVDSGLDAAVQKQAIAELRTYLGNGALRWKGSPMAQPR